jgi:hypothetical protein
MPNPIEWKEADRVETRHLPGASARLLVRRTRAPGSHPDGTPRAVCKLADATPADIVSALGALRETERAAVLQAFGADPEMRAALLADCAVAHGRAAVSEAVANETRKARVAAEAERDEARRHLCNERNGAAGLRDALATMKKERDTARDQCAQVAAERDKARNERDAAHAERDDTREELRALEWLASKGCAYRPVFVGRDCVAFAYASYAGAARALGWEG